MAIIVQKYGGTSVANAEKIKRAAGRVIKTVKKGFSVVVVASARGKQTDELIADAHELNPDPPERELDQLLSTGEIQTVSLFAMALAAAGYDDLTGEDMKNAYETLTGLDIGQGLVSPITYSPTNRQGTDSTRFYVIKGGKEVPLTGFVKVPDCVALHDWSKD